MTCILLLFSFGFAGAAVAPKLTAAPEGPFQVHGDRIVDAKGRDFLIRGTSLPEVNAASGARPRSGFGPYTGTTLITLRQRLNMNAVRLPLDSREYSGSADYRELVRQIVARVNQFELLVILEAAQADPSFWKRCAEDFKASPNVFFDVGDASSAIREIRAAGAGQPVISAGAAGDSNLIREFAASYRAVELPASGGVPLLANGLDPELAGPECGGFPDDPAEASKLVEGVLQRFDERAISWTLSRLEPGKLIDNFRGFNWTKFDDGWTCGQPVENAGIGMALLSHLWNADPHGIFTVNQPGGGLVVARGANASIYGRILADRSLHAGGYPLPTKLGNISVRVTDSRGIARPAPLSWTGAGWANANIVIPAESATGPAEVAIVRSDGSKDVSSTLITDVAPAFWTATFDGRGAVIGQVTQHFSDGRTSEFPAWACLKGGCATSPIPLTADARTTVRLEGTGLRNTHSRAAVRLWIDGVSVPVEEMGAMARDSRDYVVVRLPDTLIGRGEADLFMTADGVLSNVVRIYCGQQ